MRCGLRRHPEGGGDIEAERIREREGEFSDVRGGGEREKRVLCVVWRMCKEKARLTARL